MKLWSIQSDFKTYRTISHKKNIFRITVLRVHLYTCIKKLYIFVESCQHDSSCMHPSFHPSIYTFILFHLFSYSWCIFLFYFTNLASFKQMNFVFTLQIRWIFTFSLQFRFFFSYSTFLYFLCSDFSFWHLNNLHFTPFFVFIILCTLI